MLTFCGALFLLIHTLGVSIKLIICQQMVFTVLTNVTTIYLSVVLQNFSELIIMQDASMQFSETGTVQCHGEMKYFVLEKGK